MSSRRGISLFLLILAASAAVACDASDPARTPTRPQATAGMTEEESKTMKITLSFGEDTLAATLNDTPTARAFAAMLPLSMTLKDYAGTEKVGDLPERLTTKGAPSGSDPAVGDIAYYAPWGNLALFYKDFGFSEGLILLGSVDGDVEALRGPGDLSVTIERAD